MNFEIVELVLKRYLIEFDKMFPNHTPVENPTLVIADDDVKLYILILLGKKSVGKEFWSKLYSG